MVIFKNYVHVIFLNFIGVDFIFTFIVIYWENCNLIFYLCFYVDTQNYICVILLNFIKIGFMFVFMIIFSHMSFDILFLE